MEKIIIIGCGIIGGSLIKNLNTSKKYQLSFFDTNQNTIEVISSNYNCQFDNNFSNYQKIILCVPINNVFIYLDYLSSINFSGVIYDCSSTKYKIETYAKSLNLNLIGFHPMCGSENTGFIHSRHDLFTNKTIIISRCDSFGLELIQALGGNYKIIDSYRHDSLVAEVSHIPQLISLLLDNVSDDAREIGGNGFKDMTRLASSSSDVWHPIITTNKQNIVNQLQLLSDELTAMIDAIKCDDSEKINKYFK